MRDSYERFFSEGYITKEQFFDFGVRETIYAPLDAAKSKWEDLKQRIEGNRPVYIRGFGRNSNGSHLYQEFYRLVCGNENIQIDPTNNKEPTALIRNLTGFSKTRSARREQVKNYQVSHVFGKTKNVFAFTAPWNIVYLPKLLDPLSGHEAKGELVREYQNLFQTNSYAHFKPLIDDFNGLMSKEDFQNKVDDSLAEMLKDKRYKETDIKKLKKSVLEELSPITAPSSQ